MSEARPRIVVLSGIGENDAINGLMHSVSDYCIRGGLEVHIFNLQNYDRQHFFKTVSSGATQFGLTYLGIGQGLEVEMKSGGPQNLWEAFNLPLLKLHGDIPAYFLDRHRDVPKNSVNLYGAEEFLAFRKAALPNSTSLSMIFDPWVIDDCQEEELDFAGRASGKLFFIKNGGNPDALRNLWGTQLPASLSRLLHSLSEELRSQGLRAGRLHLHEFVAKYFDSLRVDLQPDAALFSFFVAQLDDYLRRVKSTLVGQSLTRCPVVIQGSRWDHLDLSHTKATLAPAQDFGETGAIFRTQLGIIDLTPNVDSICHDRMMRAAGTYSFVLSNRSSWTRQLLPDLDAAGFEFDPDSIRAAVEAVLAHPGRFVELGREYGRAFRRRFTPEDFVARLTLVADLTRLRHLKQKPPLQPHMVW
jgi:hypothetical protein